MCRKGACLERVLRFPNGSSVRHGVYGHILYLISFIRRFGVLYLSLYRKWRPQIFDEISGQEHITSILKKQCAKDRVSHAYLFCGTRGTGKTTSAKILAKAVNCENPQDGNPCNKCASCRAIDSGSATDVLEIDAASNNRVDNVRDLREEVVYPPSVLKKRVYIIDEVHMLTDSAFNALLKTLEEPPEYVVFILATTEINELPPTIISRCIRFDFSRIDEESVKKRIELVADAESIELAEGASSLLAQLADGSMRDALSLLEACSNGQSEALTKDIIRGVLGLAGDETVRDILHAIAEKNVPDAINIVSQIHRSSKDISVFIDDISMVVRDIIIDKQLSRYGKPSELPAIFKPLSDELTSEQLFYISSVLEETQSRISRYAMNKRTVLEMAVIRMCDRSLSESPKALSARISELEKKLSLLAVRGVTPIQSDDNANDEPKTESESIKISEAKSERMPFAEMSEVYEFLSNEPSVSAFLKQSSVFSDGNRIIISGDSFVITMLKNDSSKKALEDAFTSVSGKVVAVDFEDAVTPVKANKKQTYIDEI